jgi:actin-related protein
VFLPQPKLALLAHGVVEDGIVVNVGHRETVAVPCLGGKILREAACCNGCLGSALLTKLMLELLTTARGISYCSDSDDWSLLVECRDLKEKHCFVLPEALESLNATAGLPDVEVDFGGSNIVLGRERYLVPEVIFSPWRGSLTQLVLQAAASAVDAAGAGRDDIWSRLLGSVVVVGGAAELPGLRARLAEELSKHVAKPSFVEGHGLSQSPVVQVCAPLDELGCSPKSAVLRGGQLAALAVCTAGDPVRLLPTARGECCSERSDFDCSTSSGSSRGGSSKSSCWKSQDGGRRPVSRSGAHGSLACCWAGVGKVLACGGSRTAL